MDVIFTDFTVFIGNILSPLYWMDFRQFKDFEDFQLRLRSVLDPFEKSTLQSSQKHMQNYLSMRITAS